MSRRAGSLANQVTSASQLAPKANIHARGHHQTSGYRLSIQGHTIAASVLPMITVSQNRI
jgi:hypothetical protein